MKIRRKFAAVSTAMLLSILLLGISGLVLLREAVAYQQTASAGIKAVSELRRVNAALKELLIAPHLDVAVTAWYSATKEYRKAYSDFVNSPRLAFFLNDPEFLSQYELAGKLIQKNEEEMEAIASEIEARQASGTLGSRGFFTQAFLEQRYDSIELQSKIYNATTFFGETTVAVTTSLSDGILKRTDKIQNIIFLVFIITLILLSIIVLVIAMTFSSRIVKRIHAVRDAVKLLSTGDVSHRLDFTSKDEFGDLSRNYNTFIKEFETRLGAEIDFMREMRGALTQEMDLRNAYRVILESSIKDCYAEAGTLLLVNENTLVPEIIKGFFPPFGPIPDSIKNNRKALSELFKTSVWTESDTSPPGQILSNHDTILIKNNSATKELSGNSGEGDMSISSLIAVPLMVSGKMIAAIMVIKSTKGDYFTDMDYIHLRTFADYAALMIDNMQRYIEILEKREIDRDISIAAQVQNKLLPESIPQLHRASIHAFTEVARGVSGDYYDIVDLKDGRWLFVCCDVAGKGIAASFLMVIIRTILRVIAGRVRNLPDLMRWINHGLKEQAEEGRFATMAIIEYDSTKRELRFSNAAHPPLLGKSAHEDTFREIDAEGLPMGIDSSAVYSEQVITVKEGDVYALYSDGVTEAKNPDGQMYGQARLEQILCESADRNAKAIVEAVRKDIEKHRAGNRLNDDTTLLVLKIE